METLDLPLPLPFLSSKKTFADFFFIHDLTRLPRRRPTRRLRISPLQAPLAPPPTIPLPALPSTEPNQQLFRLTNVNAPPARTAHTKASSHSASSTSATSARARGLSVSSSTLDGDANRIDEDMKEN